jgi:hypothetical protein
MDIQSPIVPPCRPPGQKTGLIHRPLFAEITPD